MKTTKKLLILVIAVIFCTSCGMFGLSDSAWSEVFEKQNNMPQNSLDEKKKNPEMVYQTVDGKLYFREGGKIDVYEKNSTEKEKITGADVHQAGNALPAIAHSHALEQLADLVEDDNGTALDVIADRKSVV